ncbi:unnamed protein product [Pieris brassicae]|uniref:Uncharacterized protein n=1 Tax=Pieris brassicae TaxID=7116 RepID=A0A9P0X6L1_PIEBR|nr:unnamed protein product [Pieris brassicae]
MIFGTISGTVEDKIEHRGQTLLSSPDNVQATTTRRISKDDLQQLISEGINQAIDSKLGHIESLKISLFVKMEEEINFIINRFLNETECLREEVNTLKNDMQNNNYVIEELRCQIKYATTVE